MKPTMKGEIPVGDEQEIEDIINYAMAESILDAESRQVAMSNLQTRLEDAIGHSPQGLTGAELEKCWKCAKEYWNIKNE